MTIHILTLFVLSSIFGVPGNGGCLVNRGADDDLLPSSATSGLGESWRDVEGEGRASVEVAGLWGSGRQLGRVARGRGSVRSGSLDDSRREVLKLSRRIQGSAPLACVLELVDWRRRNRSQVSFRLHFCAGAEKEIVYYRNMFNN